MTTTERRTVTMPELVESLSQPDDVDLSDTLVQLWAESTQDDLEDGYAQQERIISAMLRRDVSRFNVTLAMDACRGISYINGGGCLTEEYGVRNTTYNKRKWLEYEQDQLADATNKIRGVR